MDTRSKNRHREHATHSLVNTNKTIQSYPGMTLHKCSCGWLGWITPKDN